MPSTSTENISSGNVPKMTNDEINGLFEGSPLNTAPQVWTIIKKICKGKQPSCAGCRISKILPGRICIHVSGLYVPQNCNFCVSRNFYFCTNLNCVSKKPLASNVICPPFQVLVGEGTTLTPQEYEMLVERGLPMV